MVSSKSKDSSKMYQASKEDCNTEKNTVPSLFLVLLYFQSRADSLIAGFVLGF